MSLLLTPRLGLAVYNYEVWRAINDAFRSMPVAAIVGGRIFCVHGGLSPKLSASRSRCVSSSPTLSLSLSCAGC
jgi:diadenosine tetraphosphatase ApaH/serine/threonine PP2A family protein phosphatase